MWGKTNWRGGVRRHWRIHNARNWRKHRKRHDRVSCDRRAMPRAEEALGTWLLPGIEEYATTDAQDRFPVRPFMQDISKTQPWGKVKPCRVPKRCPLGR